MVQSRAASLVNQDAHAISPSKRRRTLKHKAHLIYITLTLPCGHNISTAAIHQTLPAVICFAAAAAAITSPVAAAAAAANKLACVIGHAKWLATHNHLNSNEAAIKASSMDETCGEIWT